MFSFCAISIGKWKHEGTTCIWY